MKIYKNATTDLSIGYFSHEALLLNESFRSKAAVLVSGGRLSDQARSPIEYTLFSHSGILGDGKYAVTSKRIPVEMLWGTNALSKVFSYHIDPSDPRFQ
jgi:hypothetical protein